MKVIKRPGGHSCLDLIHKTLYILRIMLLLTLQLNGVPTNESQAKKVSWNFIAYKAMNNNLFQYGINNIKQMQQIGSNKHINIFAQIDNFGKNESVRYKVEKGRLVTLKVLRNNRYAISGTTESLYDFLKSIITKYPADHQALILSSHGSGIKDPHLWMRGLPYQQFMFNEATQLYELDSNFSDMMGRGIAFNDVGRTYLTNQELKATLERASRELLGGKKFDIIGMDACHMAMIEVGSQIKKSARFFVASEEASPGTGWEYNRVLAPFVSHSLTPAEFAKHITAAYGQTYNHRFGCLTHSTINLEHLDALERNIDTAAVLMIELLNTAPDTKFFDLIKEIRTDKSLTTSFHDPDYTDLGHLYTSILNKLETFQASERVAQLKTTLAEGLSLLSVIVVANSTGIHTATAQGLAIYFPRKTIHSSYLKTEFSKITNWCSFLYTFIKTRRKNCFAYLP